MLNTLAGTLLLVAAAQFVSTADEHLVRYPTPNAEVEAVYRLDPSLGELTIFARQECSAPSPRWFDDERVTTLALQSDALAEFSGFDERPIESLIDDWDFEGWQSSLTEVGGTVPLSYEYLEGLRQALSGGGLQDEAGDLILSRFACWHVPDPVWWLEQIQAPILLGAADAIERAEFQIFMTRVARAYPELPIEHPEGAMLELSAAIELAQWMQDRARGDVEEGFGDASTQLALRSSIPARTLAYVIQQSPYLSPGMARLFEQSMRQDASAQRHYVIGETQVSLQRWIRSQYLALMRHITLSQSRAVDQPGYLRMPPPPTAPPPPPPPPSSGFEVSMIALVERLGSDRAREFSFTAADFLNRFRLGADETLEERLSGWDEVSSRARPPQCNDPSPGDWRWGSNDRLPLRFVRECLTQAKPDFVSDANASITAMLGYTTPSGWYFVPFCSATVVRDDLVVTARHCFDFDDRCTASQSGRLKVFIPATGQERSVAIADGEAALGGYCGRRVRDGDNPPDDILVLSVLSDSFTDIPTVSVVSSPRALQTAQIGGWAATSLDPASEEISDWQTHFRWPAGNENACFVFMEGEGCVTHLCMTGEGFSGAALTQVDPDPLTYGAQLLGVHTGAEGYCRTGDPLLAETINFINENGYEYLRYNEAVSGQALCGHLEKVSDFRCE